MPFLNNIEFDAFPKGNFPTKGTLSRPRKKTRKANLVFGSRLNQTLCRKLTQVDLQRGRQSMNQRNRTVVAKVHQFGGGRLFRIFYNNQRRFQQQLLLCQLLVRRRFRWRRRRHVLVENGLVVVGFTLSKFAHFHNFAGSHRNWNMHRRDQRKCGQVDALRRELLIGR